MLHDTARVLITGAGSGIGRALAVEAANRGMRVVIAGRRMDPLRETAGAMGNAKSVITMQADVTSAQDRSALLARIQEQLGALDYLINNAGSVAVGRFDGLSEDEMMHLFTLNVTAPAMLSQAALPLLCAAPKGRIVNVGSMFGDIAFPRFAAYSASKFALRGLSDGLRRELAQDGIGVTYAAPRATRTPAADRFMALAKPMQMVFDPPGKVARRIWNAAEAGKSRVYPGLGERIATIAQALLPSILDRHIAKLEMRVRNPTEDGLETHPVGNVTGDTATGETIQR
ncbi:SDR family NAD(P)-dependent oxidoreductase [Hwanghaeella grinnelliae]|uniref:SDR family NAD(P)-dependent oxidoreductase n=1 Tax=Hwanghaeella grinnelliae TaxID=2500179 RepID=A0A3S2Z620_9PROT|nr:SDR family NAD(P)-dependent oxidoreductase [Hwanghaeella grinnelliae]RVU33895.1 SDR family NAD(P)-dependent oxidoreductase [Hwanghaeella grinnelliae]